MERLARQALSGEAPESGEDARVLRGAFEQTIKDLADEYGYQEERAQLLQKVHSLFSITVLVNLSRIPIFGISRNWCPDNWLHALAPLIAHGGRRK